MSASTAIDLVTKKLKELLERPEYVGPNMVFTKPLDKAVSDEAVAGSVNLFLYETTINAAWRNQDFPTPRRGQPGRTLLPLTLHYLLTAFGTVDSDENAHVALGKAMLALHDHPDLTPKSTDWNQPDAAHVTLQPLTLDEMSKLWSAFQASYRLSVAYQVSTVLIESGTEGTAALPVRKLGEKKRGWDSTTQFPPLVERIELTDKTKPGLTAGDFFEIHGRDLLAAGTLSIGFEPVNRRMSEQQIAAAAVLGAAAVNWFAATVVDKSSSRIVCEAGDTPAGVYLVSVRHTTRDADVGDRTTTSNAVPVAVLPEVLQPTAPFRIVEFTDDENVKKYSVTLRCKPPKEGQRCQVLVGSRAFNADSSNGPAGSTIFTWPAKQIALRDGEKAYVRVSIDGVESLIPEPDDDKPYIAILPPPPDGP